MNNRNSMIAKIKIAQKQLSIDNESYRALLLRLTGKTSCAQLTNEELDCVIQEMRRLGFISVSKKHAKPKCCKQSAAMIGKVAALLADNKLPWSYAHKMSQHMFNVNRVQWLNDRHLHKLIAALQIHADKIHREKQDAI